MLLWQEYKQQHPEGCGYSRFCELYRHWRRSCDAVMRQNHRAGEKLFVDYAGMTVPIFDTEIGQQRRAQIFVAVLGASNYTYCEATWTQSLPDWIGAHVRAFTFFGGVPEIVVPDNLKAGVNKAHRYEPDLNPTYADLAAHYGIAIIPARVRKPRDKAKVEVGVQIIERWILAVLRKQTFLSLEDLNEAIAKLLEGLNKKPFKKLPGSRQCLFEELDRLALKPLPMQAYEFAEWKKARVNIDCHIELDGHYYSVPHQLLKKQIDVRYTAHTVECFYRSKRITSHRRSPYKGRHTTITAHLPKAHREYAGWTPERITDWALQVGLETSRWVQHTLQSRPHPVQAYRSCLGVLRLSKSYGTVRLEAACRRANRLKSYSYKSVASILKNGLDHIQDQHPEPVAPITHKNIRGSAYYTAPPPLSGTTLTPLEGVPYAQPSHNGQTSATPTHRHDDCSQRAARHGRGQKTEF